MSLSQRIAPAIASALALCLVGTAACRDAGPTVPGSAPTLAAKGGGGGGSGGPGPKVNEAIPSEAEQDTTLDVKVVGSGFDDGSTVRFLLAGQSTPKLVVNSSAFVDTDTLLVNLAVAADADVASYDIEVTTLRGKKGIGSEKFTVKLKGGGPEDGIPVDVTFRDAAGDGVLSDGLGPYLGANAEGVILDLGNLRIDARADNARQLCFDFAGQAGAPDVTCDDGYLTTSRADVEGGFPAMAVGSTMTTAVQVTWVQGGFNWFLRFGLDCQNDDDTNRATVYRADGATWVLTGDMASLCRLPVKGRPRVDLIGVYSMPFQVTVVR